jgi:hypothetical protein
VSPVTCRECRANSDINRDDLLMQLAVVSYGTKIIFRKLFLKSKGQVYFAFEYILENSRLSLRGSLLK